MYVCVCWCLCVWEGLFWWGGGRVIGGKSGFGLYIHSFSKSKCVILMLIQSNCGYMGILNSIKWHRVCLWGTSHTNTIVMQNVLWKPKYFFSHRGQSMWKRFQQIWHRRVFWSLRLRKTDTVCIMDTLKDVPESNTQKNIQKHTFAQG